MLALLTGISEIDYVLRVEENEKGKKK